MSEIYTYRGYSLRMYYVYDLYKMDFSTKRGLGNAGEVIGKEKGKEVMILISYRGERLGEDPSVINKYLPRTSIVPSSRRRP